MDGFPTVQECADRFVGMALPEDAPPVQFREMRKAFVTGFWTCFTLIEMIAELPEDEGFKILDDLDDQLRETLRGLDIDPDSL